MDKSKTYTYLSFMTFLSEPIGINMELVPPFTIVTASTPFQFVPVDIFVPSPIHPEEYL